MEHRVRYALLGIFVFVLFGAGVWLLLWQSKYAHNETYDYYVIQTQESVSGLNEKAPVKLRGVNVGEVERLFITPEDSQTVSIVIKIKESTPIKTDTYALIEPQGITGLSYLQLEGGSREAELMKTTSENDGKMAIIYTKPSLFSRVDSSFESIARKTEEVLESANKVLEKIGQIVSEKNVRHLEIVLENSAQISQDFAQSTKSIQNQQEAFQELLNQALELEKSVIAAAHAVKAMSDAGAETMLRVGGSANSVKDVMGKVGEKIDAGMFDIAQITQDATAPLEGTFYEMEQLVRQLRQLVRQFEQSPSDLLYRSAPVQPAPGEKP
jgi:phospholipid/cholesterol/gamma-HCH transport system substrate-binding protein